MLYGVKPQYVYLEDSISYLSGVTASDNADADVTITVDTSRVDASRIGTYTVIYHATDKAGNTSSQSTTVTIKRVTTSEEKLDRYVQRILREIITDDMTLADKVFAIYDYVYTHVKYRATSDKTDWRKEALRGIQKGRGDCFTSNCVARALLEAVGAKVSPIERKSYNTNHYWLLVNIGTGWYHMDATNSREHHYRCCMWTDTQCSVMGRFWKYDPNANPPVSKERFNRDKAAEVEAEWLASIAAETENNG